MASQVLLVLELAPVVAVRGNTDKSNLSSARATVRGADGVDQARTIAVTSRITLIDLTSKKVARIHGSEIASIFELVITSVELESVSKTRSGIFEAALQLEMSLFVIGGVEGHDIGIAPHNHEVLVVVLEFRVVLKPSAPVLRTALDLVQIAVDPESAVKERVLAVAVDHDTSPAGLVPASLIRPANEGLAAKDLVF
jgi:hypothetical protein